MIDYSLPVARRTRRGYERIHKEYCQEKKRKKNSGADPASSTGLGEKKGLAKKVKRCSGSKRLEANSRKKTARESIVVSDSSLEEIGGSDWDEEGNDGAGNSMGLKNSESSSAALDRTNNVEQVMTDDREDELVVLGDRVGLDGREMAQNFVVIDDDDDDGVDVDVDDGDDVDDVDDDDDVPSGKDVNKRSHSNSEGRSSDKMAPSMTTGKSSCLNFDTGKSSGGMNRNDSGDGDDEAWDDSDSSEGDEDEDDGNDISVDSIWSETSLESSFDDTDSDYVAFA